MSLGNSNPEMIRFVHKCMRRLSDKQHFQYSFQFHADQDPDELRHFWAAYLNIDPLSIYPVPKTNSGHLKGREFACKYGIFTVRVGDTLFRSRLQALMDTVQAQWASPNPRPLIPNLSRTTLDTPRLLLYNYELCANMRRVLE